MISVRDGQIGMHLHQESEVSKSWSSLTSNSKLQKKGGIFWCVCMQHPNGLLDSGTVGKNRAYLKTMKRVDNPGKNQKKKTD